MNTGNPDLPGHASLLSGRVPWAQDATAGMVVAMQFSGTRREQLPEIPLVALDWPVGNHVPLLALYWPFREFKARLQGRQTRK